MAAAVIQEPEVAPEVEALTDETRRELVALREGGMTLAELKVRFPQLTSEQIREVLPPGNARERKARQPKQPKAQTKPKAQAEPKPAPTPRYAADPGDLPERVVAARKLLGRKALAEALSISESTAWRAEHGRVHPSEVTPLTDALTNVEERIAAGEFKKAEHQPKAAAPSKAELTHRVETVVELLKTARGDKSITKAALIDSALAVLDPTDAPKA
jgi:hypothetical protein